MFVKLGGIGEGTKLILGFKSLITHFKVTNIQALLWLCYSIACLILFEIVFHKTLDFCVLNMLRSDWSWEISHQSDSLHRWVVYSINELWCMFSVCILIGLCVGDRWSFGLLLRLLIVVGTWWNKSNGDIGVYKDGHNWMRMWHVIIIILYFFYCYGWG